MQIHLARNGQTLGQHEAEAVPALLQNGTVLATDLYWHDGMAEWAEVGSKWPAAPADAPPVLSAAATEPAAVPLDRASVASASPTVMRGARWFWWIAGFSVVNTILMNTGSDMSFVIGLGFTLVADSIFQSLKIVALGIDLMAVAFFFGAGWFAGRGHFWAFVVGIVAYFCDALIYLLAQDWMPVGFHGLALFYLIRGARELRADLRAARAPA